MSDVADPIRLRAHHLLCVLTFAGHGYSEAFVANLRQIVERLRAGERVTLSEGPDDICAPLCEGATPPHCHEASVIERDRLARSAMTALPELAPILAGKPQPLSTAQIARLRARFADGSIRSACDGCEWSPLCSQLAAGGFAETVL